MRISKDNAVEPLGADSPSATRRNSETRLVLATMTTAERERRLERVARYLVRTMKSCPAPGIAPLSIRDWLTIAAAVLLPYLLLYGLAAMATR